MLSKKSINAINALVWLGLLQDQGPVSLLKISSQLQLSISCLEQIFATLKSQSVITSFKGPGGGYCINHELSELSLWDIASYFEADVKDDSSKEQVAEGKISQDKIFSEFKLSAQKALSEITLEDAIQSCMKNQSASAFKREEKENRFRLKPLPSMPLPKGPNSVFTWASGAQAA
jgi:Rrf2 family iron-sulfur cluster assembly transcriptional regulator